MRSWLITGCNRGIGLELVKQLLNHPTARIELLIGTCRNLETSVELKALSKQHSILRVLEFDTNKFETYPDFVKKVSILVGEAGLTVLLNNAGILLGRKDNDVTGVKAQELISQYITNCVAPVMLTQALLPLLKKASIAGKQTSFGIERAAVINMSSFLASISLNDSKGGYWGYRESKAALNQATRTLALELKDVGVAVLLLHPGWVQTDMGGPDALLPVTESVAGLIKVMLRLDSSTHGAFIQHSGEVLPW